MRDRMRDQKRAVCANCKQRYREGDQYCRYCGAPMGTPDYIDIDFACIYGPPPVRRIHTCEACGFSWETVLMLDGERWCPRCGGAAPVTGSDERSIWMQPH